MQMAGTRRWWSLVWSAGKNAQRRMESPRCSFRIPIRAMKSARQPHGRSGLVLRLTEGRFGEDAQGSALRRYSFVAFERAKRLQVRSFRGHTHENFLRNFV